MNTHFKAASLSALAVLFLWSPSVWGQSGDVAVVVNAKNSVSELTLPALRKIFNGEKRAWPGGTSVKLIVRAPKAHERDVLLRLMQLSEDGYKTYWTSQEYRGEEAEPVAVYSNGMQKEAVMAIPGAIALIDAGDVKPGLKVLKIEGKLPGQEGYPLH